MSDLGASLLKWIQLTGYLSSVTMFGEIDDPIEFMDAFRELFPDSKDFGEDDLESFIEMIKTRTPLSLRSKLNDINEEDFDSANPETLEQITKAFLYIMYNEKKEDLMRQIDELESNEQDDIKNLLAESFYFNGNKESEDLSKLAESILRYSVEFDEASKKEKEIEELKQKKTNIELLRDSMIKERTEKGLEKYKQEIEGIHKAVDENNNEESEIKKILAEIKELEKKENEFTAIQEKKRKLNKEKSELLAELEKAEKEIEKRQNVNKKYEEFVQKKNDLNQSIETLEKLGSLLNEEAEITSVVEKKMEILENEKNNGEVAELLRKLDNARSNRDEYAKKLNEVCNQLSSNV